VVVGDLMWENPPSTEVTMFGQPVTGYSQDWLLATAACWALVQRAVENLRLVVERGGLGAV
jgi:hypothetical protein